MTEPTAQGTLVDTAPNHPSLDPCFEFLQPDLHKHPVSIVQVFLKQSARRDILQSQRWFDFIKTVVSEPNWCFMSHAWVDCTDPCTLVLIVGWKVDTQPSPTFAPGDTGTLNNLLAPLRHFLVPEKPRVLNMSRTDTSMDCAILSESYSCGRSGVEIILTTGPEEELARRMTDIEHSLRVVSRLCRTFRGSSRPGPVLEPRLLAVDLFQVDDDMGLRNALDDESDAKQATFALILNWSSLRDRTHFQGSDTESESGGRNNLLRDTDRKIWDMKARQPLKELTEQGASVTSWTYHESQISTTRNKKRKACSVSL